MRLEKISREMRRCRNMGVKELEARARELFIQN
jgi:hypothetical protein